MTHTNAQPNIHHILNYNVTLQPGSQTFAGCFTDNRAKTGTMYMCIIYQVKQTDV